MVDVTVIKMDSTNIEFLFTGPSSDALFSNKTGPQTKGFQLAINNSILTSNVNKILAVSRPNIILFKLLNSTLTRIYTTAIPPPTTLPIVTNK